MNYRPRLVQLVDYETLPKNLVLQNLTTSPGNLLVQNIITPPKNLVLQIDIHNSYKNSTRIVQYFGWIDLYLNNLTFISLSNIV